MATKIPATPPAETKKARAPKTAAVGKAAKIAKAEKPLTPSQKLDKIGIEAICAYIAGGDSLRSWAMQNGFVQQSVINWIDADAERAGHYAHARDDRADAVFDSLDDVSNQAVTAETAVEVAGLRLKSDNIKWKLARMNAKKYGDKLDITADVTVSQLTDEQLMAKARVLGAKVGLLPNTKS